MFSKFPYRALFFTLFIFVLPAIAKAECYPQANGGHQNSCSCIEQFGHCECPQGHCACIEHKGQCNCNHHPSTHCGSLSDYEGSSQGLHRSCSCIEQLGHCECPQGQCACIENQGHCDCNHAPVSDCDPVYNYDLVSDCNLSCDCADPCQVLPLPQHQFYIGPEFYYISRDKDGKDGRAKQHGYIYGGRAGYDRIKRYRIYWGVEGVYATGDIRGHKKGKKVKIDFTDENIEGRLGYTFQMKKGWMPAFVPFVGYGYIRETSKFKKPSPIPIKQRITFDYIAAGFLSQFYPHPLWVVGVNFKARFLFNSKCKISDDPDYEDFTQNIEHKVQYRVELPITYRLNCWCDHLAVAVVPFWDYRHYGEHANFPFDFKDVKLNFYGFDLRLMYMF